METTGHIVQNQQTLLEGDTILPKLHKIMDEAGVIGKDAKNTFHKYDYASEHAIKTTVKPLLVEHGVLFQLSADRLKLEQVGEDLDSTKVVIHFTYRFYNIEDGSYLQGSFVGEGEDKGDKATWKAVTGALKYILTSNLFIPTGDDPEADEKVDKRNYKKKESSKKTDDKATNAQLNLLEKLENQGKLKEKYDAKKLTKFEASDLIKQATS